MLPPEEAEVSLLSSIRTPQDLTILLREGVTEEAFLVYGDVFRHYLQYSREYGSLPKHSDVALEFRDLGLEFREPGELSFYLQEVLKLDLVRRTQATIIERLGEQGSRLVADPAETVRALTEDLRKLQHSSVRHVAWLDRDALVRLGWLQEKAEAARERQVLGIPTGLACFDRRMQGWGPGEAIMVMAPKGVGKSWLALYFGVVAYRAGYKVLFLSPEMAWEECALRFDVLLAHQVGVGLSHTDLSTGQQDQAEYETWLRELTRREQFIVIDSPEAGGFTAANTLALIEEHRPDLVLLDGLHLIGGDPKQSGWERIKQAADALKATAQHLKCTVVWTSQVDREAMRNPTEPAATGASAAYGKAGVEAANRLITLANFEHDSRRKTFKVPNNRSGQEFHTRQHLLFDVDVGAIRQLEGGAAVQEGEEVF